MARPKYSVKIEEKHAKAYSRDARVSRKDSAEIARTIKGMNTKKAKELLRKVMEKEKHIPYKKYYKKVPHRKGKGWKPGKYPVKASKTILGLIESAEKNAEYEGMDLDNLIIKHIATHQGLEFTKPDFRRAGIGSRSIVELKRKTTNIEIILTEK